MEDSDKSLFLSYFIKQYLNLTIEKLLLIHNDNIDSDEYPQNGPERDEDKQQQVTSFPINSGNNYLDPDFVNFTNLNDTIIFKSDNNLKYPVFTFRSLVIVIIYCVFFIGSAIGNINAFINLFRSRRRKSSMTLLMIHLTIADLIVTLIMLPFEIIWRVTVKFLGGNVACKIMLFLRVFGLYLSSNVLICISIDRYFAVMHPMLMINKRRRGKWMLGGAWVFATLASIPQLLIFHVEQHPNFSNFTQCVGFGYFSSPSYEITYNITCLALMYFLPLAVIVWSYSSIFWKLWRKSVRSAKDDKRRRLSEINLTTRSTNTSNNSNANSNANSNLSEDEIRSTRVTRNLPKQTERTRNTSIIGAKFNKRDHVMLRRSDRKSIEKSRIRTLKMTSMIVIVYIICCTPYAVMTLWYMLDKESAQKVPEWLQDSLFMMVVSNSCVNPLMYRRYRDVSREGGNNTGTSKRPKCTTKRCITCTLYCCLRCSFDQWKLPFASRRRNNRNFSYQCRYHDQAIQFPE